MPRSNLPALSVAEGFGRAKNALFRLLKQQLVPFVIKKSTKSAFGPDFRQIITENAQKCHLKLKNDKLNM
ncbi:MAG: hypothetical protein DRP65_11565 [Planctomycetota bacterium]|nr:MAG: hypothetical protein DRP65_11565 [Planctomycetota bacterium]